MGNADKKFDVSISGENKGKEQFTFTFEFKIKTDSNCRIKICSCQVYDLDGNMYQAKGNNISSTDIIIGVSKYFSDTKKVNVAISKQYKSRIGCSLVLTIADLDEKTKMNICYQKKSAVRWDEVGVQMLEYEDIIPEDRTAQSKIEAEIQEIESEMNSDQKSYSNQSIDESNKLARQESTMDEPVIEETVIEEKVQDEPALGEIVIEPVYEKKAATPESSATPGRAINRYHVTSYSTATQTYMGKEEEIKEEPKVAPKEEAKVEPEVEVKEETKTESDNNKAEMDVEAEIETESVAEANLEVKDAEGENNTETEANTEVDAEPKDESEDEIEAEAEVNGIPLDEMSGIERLLNSILEYDVQASDKIGLVLDHVYLSAEENGTNYVVTLNCNPSPSTQRRLLVRCPMIKAFF